MIDSESMQGPSNIVRAPTRASTRGALLALALVTALVEPGHAQTFHARGVYYFAGSVTCPLAGVGSRDANESNRLALDDQYSEVTVDRATHRIVFKNAHTYPRKQLVGDLLLLGVGTTSAGTKVPLGIHLKIEKRRNTFTAQVHPHPTVRDKIVSAEFEPFEVVLANGESDVVALTPDTATKAVREPELAARVANIFLQVTDNLEGHRIAPDQPNAPLVDVSIGFGVQPLNLKVARVQLRSLEAGNAPLIARGDLAAMLRTGTWELQITSLSSLLPKEEFDRDLFLLGIDGMPILAKVKTHGLGRGETLAVGFRDGKGFVRTDSASADIPNPADVARAYLEFNFVGGVIAHQVALLPSKVQESTITPPPRSGE